MTPRANRSRIDTRDCQKLLEGQEESHRAEMESRDRAHAMVVRGYQFAFATVFTILAGLVGLRIKYGW